MTTRVPSFILILGAIVVLVSLPMWADDHWVFLAFLWFLYMCMAQMWNLVGGFAGLVSLGQQVFLGFGGYALAIFTLGEYGFALPVWMAILIGAFLSCLFALAIAIPVFRMRGFVFAIGTLVISEAVRTWFNNWKYTKMDYGIFIRTAWGIPLSYVYYASLALALATLFFMHFILNSKFGYGIRAIGDDEEAASTVGVDPFRCKLYCWLIAAFITGIVGGLYYTHGGFIKPSSAFNLPIWTMMMISATAIGGIRTIEGPMIGATFIVAFRQYLAEYLYASLIIEGAIIMVVILFVPEGLIGILRKLIGRLIKRVKTKSKGDFEQISNSE